MRSKAYYAAIDLGSNSFHMLVVRVVAGSVQVVSKIKRKVRLAAGLTDDGELSEDAKQRAIDCLRIFSDRVQDIDPSHIRAVGTATLRKIAQDKDFLAHAENTLGHPIQIISGDEEAATIYQGIAHTTAFKGRMLVIDIGGASTELVLGSGFTPQLLNSLDMGCVTWYSKYFNDGAINSENTIAAINGATETLRPFFDAYNGQQWSLVLGASGTFKALQEIAEAKGANNTFKLQWMEQLLEQAIACGHHQQLQIEGLADNRKAVFVSGLCILIALCRNLTIKSLQSTSGALREGILYSMLEPIQQQDVQLRTLHSLVANYHLDEDQSLRVFSLAENFYRQLEGQWTMPPHSLRLLRAASYLHELGLSLSYKQASSHATYMLRHLDLPGFDQAARAALIELLAATAGIIDDEKSSQFASSSQPMRHLTRLLRLAIMCCQRRCDSSITNYQVAVNNGILTLSATTGFFDGNPFLLSLLQDEAEQLPDGEQLQLKAR
ncbi:guanosine-5'-triphosphate,3'-diphosphate pyrophosphatase [Aliidiomarina minuta]|uniref:Guanosine-5'-triphosphate,3'-diphosphate pyrophosphatase n=1 Tax=Aliidiomarina minuta TaxID=880057 RepID=A0A432W3V4_9GAMM|nr:guanosine-5'-triphosphate,3'-diphosphate pyrophosphatase [Aliidiomarina minuta]RUO24012.1 guanosine-5'-triphosphate,3'-diphosphate pyrophosphatase [Aliidiomarina minuta]